MQRYDYNKSERRKRKKDRDSSKKRDKNQGDVSKLSNAQSGVRGSKLSRKSGT